MKMILKIFGVTLVTLLCIHSVVSADKPCGQHDFKVVYLRNCKGKGIPNTAVQLQNITFTLTDDCRAIPRGCYLIKKKLTDIKINYHLSKPPILNKNGTSDLCQVMGEQKFQSMASQYKTVDSKCPIEAGQYCITKGSSVIDKLNPGILNMAVGTIKARVEVISEKAKVKSCIETEIVVSRKSH